MNEENNPAEVKLTPEQYKHYQLLLEKEEKQKAKQKRIAAKQYLLAKKAKAAGLSVSEIEIDEYLVKTVAA